jgi:beta-lactamase class A
MNVKARAPFLAAVLLLLGTPLWSDNAMEAKALSVLFQAGRSEYASLFSDQFLSQVPEAKIREIVQLYSSNLGAYRSAAGGSGDYRLTFEKGEAPCKISVDSAGKITGLWFGPWTLSDDTPLKVRDAFAALAGAVSVCVVRDGGQVVFSVEPDSPLAVGSAFKLYVLKALDQKIRAGAARWEDVVRLNREWTSLPSGILQDWPEDTPVTLATLASLMISISDDTAADHLLFWLGRDAVQVVAPARLRPFLSTSEMFRLKWGVPEKDRQAYLDAPADVKARLLLTLPPLDKIPIASQSVPVSIDTIEWLVTTRELCGVIYELKANRFISINPGLVDKKKWAVAGYKGGSEPGVLNYTHVIQKDGSRPVYAVSATINDPRKEVDTQGFTAVVSRLIGLIERGGLEQQRP